MVLDANAEQAKSLAQAKFFLRGFSDDVNGNLSTLEKWGTQMTKNTGVSNEYAVLVGAKLANRLGNVNKAMQYSGTLLKLQQLGLVNASDASNMLLRAQDGNARALRFLLEQMGLAVPEFSSLENMFAILEKRVNGLSGELSPFATQWQVMKEIFNNLIGEAGAPLAKALGGILEGINGILGASPQLQKFVGFMVILVASVFSLAGAIAFLTPVFSLFGIAVSASGVMMLGALVVAILFALFVMGEADITLKDLVAVWTNLPQSISDAWATFTDAYSQTWVTIISVTVMALGTILLLLVLGVGGWLIVVIAVLVAIITAIAVNWKLIVGYVSDGMLASYNAYKTGWETIKVIWNAGLTFISDLWTTTWSAMSGFFMGIWDGIIAKVTSAIDYLKQKLAEAQAMFSSATSAVSSPITNAFNSAKGAVSNAISAISGKKAGGGSVMGGSSYLVGEKGAEIFTPRTSGSIIPNGRLQGNGGGGLTVVIQGNSFMGEQDMAVRVGDLIVRQLQNVIKIGL
jgi:hypothetical protein